MLWKDGEARTRHEFEAGTIYSPDDLMWHGHFNTGKGTMRHFAVRGDSRAQREQASGIERLVQRYRNRRPVSVADRIWRAEVCGVASRHR